MSGFGTARPTGVLERIRATQAEERRVPQENRLRHGLVALVTSSGKQGFPDHDVAADFDLVDEVLVWRGDLRQRRSGSDLERRSLEFLARMEARLVAARARSGGPLSLEVTDELRAFMLDDVRAAVLGDRSAPFFDLICWNEANSVLEGVRRPYIAASSIAGTEIFGPDDIFGLIPSLTAARIEFEDVPSRREALNGEITTILTDYVRRAGWPGAAEFVPVGGRPRQAIHRGRGVGGSTGHGFVASRTGSARLAFGPQISLTL